MGHGWLKWRGRLSGLFMAGICLSLWEDEVAPPGTREAGTMTGQFISDYFLSPHHCQVLSWTAYLEN